ncbi:mediator of RNA polymerase II transcription subunit 17-like isoform X1 [Primulina huaijiensis]|uniref:mediator of RNA polymerase II transcription subunit 17-like isoform X1 n=1 Tax=Primulina huaijiensis TaxID=1492673 RepID=UPI003CC768FD
MAEDLKDLKVSLDKLPIKRLDAIEENGFERFPLDVGYDEKRVNLIRRIDFAWVVEREDPNKKQKKEGATSAKDVTTNNQQSWQWQSLVENLQLAHQELSVIIDLINTVEANDSVTVAGMTRPKQLPYEHLSDLAVSTATKLQSFRHLGKTFKQSAKALEEQVAREARFYGALIRLQQNWKVKRHRLVAAASGKEGFYIDLSDSSLNDLASAFRPSSMSTILVEHDAAGMLAVNLPQNSRRSLHFEFLGYNVTKLQTLPEKSAKETRKEHASDDKCVREIHSILRDVYRAIYDEHVFDLVNREACSPSLAANLTGIRENYLRLNIDQEESVSISLLISDQVHQTSRASNKNSPNEATDEALGSFDGLNFGAGIEKAMISGIPNRVGFEIYLRQLYHEYAFVRSKNAATSSFGTRSASQSVKDSSNILGHFCMSIAHRIFSNKVLLVLESLVCRTPYIHLISHPTWRSRSSTWILSMKIPQSILQAGSQFQLCSSGNMKNVRSQFWTKVVVIDDSIKVEGEGAPNVVGLFKGKADGFCAVNGYNCDLADLPIILLQQIASHIIQWLHEEALVVGIKANRDFLSLAFELEHGEIVSLVAHVDPDNIDGCISWWLIMDDGPTEEHKFHSDLSNGESESRKFLGYLSLDVLYSTLLDFLNLCSC